MKPGKLEPLRSQPSLILLERMQRGDAAAREELIQRYWPRLERWAHGRLPRGARDLNDTTDLVQDTMVAALNRLQEFAPDHDGALQAYFRVALLNRIRSLAERTRRRGERVTLESLLADHRPSPLEEAIGRESLESYERALDRLRPDDRDAIVLRIELDLPYEEIAHELGKLTMVAARKAVSRALYRLAREMQRDA
jgi:RNA polymerase sigma-70 factor (ECF subfamily)